jgi:hypothetical protein
LVDDCVNVLGSAARNTQVGNQQSRNGYGAPCARINQHLVVACVDHQAGVGAGPLGPGCQINAVPAQRPFQLLLGCVGTEQWGGLFVDVGAIADDGAFKGPYLEAGTCPFTPELIEPSAPQQKAATNVSTACSRRRPLGQPPAVA